MARRRPRHRKDAGLGWAGLGGILLLLLAIAAGGALAYFYFATPARVVLDAETLCPVSGPQGITVVLVEHDMKMVMNLSDRILVLDYGKRLAEGSGPEVRGNPDVIAAYLGGHA